MHCGTASAVPASYVSNISLALVAFVGCHGIGSHAPPHSLSHLASLSRLRLWAWERRQDLRSLDTKEFASAYLDQTLTIGLGVESQPRRDPFIFSASSTRIPVVRIEATRLSVLDDKNRAEAVRAILASAGTRDCGNADRLRRHALAATVLPESALRGSQANACQSSVVDHRTCLLVLPGQLVAGSSR